MIHLFLLRNHGRQDSFVIWATCQMKYYARFFFQLQYTWRKAYLFIVDKTIFPLFGYLRRAPHMRPLYTGDREVTRDWLPNLVQKRGWVYVYVVCLFFCIPTTVSSHRVYVIYRRWCHFSPTKQHSFDFCTIAQWLMKTGDNSYRVSTYFVWYCSDWTDQDM